jgi:aromatic ring hydroxylase
MAGGCGKIAKLFGMLRDGVERPEEGMAPRKLNVTRFPFEITRLAQDIAGGILVTMPSLNDRENPEIGPYVKKYLVGKEGVDSEKRMRLLRLIENITLGAGAVSYLTESIHGAGSPQAQKIMADMLGNRPEALDPSKVQFILRDGHYEC